MWLIIVFIVHIFSVIEPIFNPMFAFLFLGEAMSRTAEIGGVLVLSGVIGRSLIQQSSSTT